MCDKMAIYAYILKIVEKDPLLRLQMRAKEMFNSHHCLFYCLSLVFHCLGDLKSFTLAR